MVPSGSTEADPLRVTVSPGSMSDWSAPALAVGASDGGAATVTVMVSAVLVAPESSVTVRENVSTPGVEGAVKVRTGDEGSPVSGVVVPPVCVQFQATMKP